MLLRYIRRAARRGNTDKKHFAQHRGTPSAVTKAWAEPQKQRCRGSTLLEPPAAFAAPNTKETGLVQNKQDTPPTPHPPLRFTQFRAKADRLVSISFWLYLNAEQTTRSFQAVSGAKVDHLGTGRKVDHSGLTATDTHSALGGRPPCLT